MSASRQIEKVQQVVAQLRHQLRDPSFEVKQALLWQPGRGGTVSGRVMGAV